MNYNLKNQLIFKGKLENILTLMKVWKLKKNKFDIGVLFEEPYEQNLFRVIQKFEENSTSTVIDSLYTKIRLEVEKKFSGDEKDELFSYINSIEKIKLRPDEIEHARHEINIYIKENATFLALQESAEIFDKIKAKHYSQVGKTFYEIFEKIESAVKINPETGENLGINLSDIGESELEDAFAEGTIIPFPSAFPSLDMAVDHSGVTTKTLNLILGATYTGKTRTALNLAVGYFKNGYDVVYHTMEISQTEIMVRILSILLEKNKKELRKMPRKELLKLYFDYRAQNKLINNFYIKEYASGYYTVNDFKEYITDMKATVQDKKNLPKLYFIDGINNMEVETPKAYTNSYFKMKDIAYKLQGIAKQNDIAVWACAQLSKQAMHKVGNDMEKVQEGFSLSQACDFNIIVESTKEMDEVGIQAILVDKNRYSAPYREPIFVKIEDKKRFNMHEILESDIEYQQARTLYAKGIKGGKDTFNFDD